MLKNLTHTKKALIFYAITFTLSIAVALTAPTIGDTVRAVTMLTPVIAWLLVKLPGRGRVVPQPL